MERSTKILKVKTYFELFLEEQAKKEVLNNFKTIDGLDSSWNRLISFEELNNIFVNFFDNNEQIFSIGSGGGHLEHSFNNYVSRINKIMCMIGIDPNPKSYSKEVKLAPLYENIQQLISLKPEVIENCQIAIIWSSPGNSNYDIDAILTLKPKKIIILYEETGAAGGEKLHKFINKCEYLKENCNENNFDERYNYDIKYKVNTLIERKFTSKISKYDVDYYILKSFERIG